MKKITPLICTIFTVLVLTFALLSPFHMAPVLTNAVVVQGFVMAITVAVLMTAADIVTKSSNWIVDGIIKLLICYVVVFFEGAFFKMIEFSWKGLLEITPALIPIFLVSYVVQYITCVEWANSINDKIKHKR